MLSLFVSRFGNLLPDDCGQDLVEYALVVAIIALGATAAMTTLSDAISILFTRIDFRLTIAS